MVFRKGHRLLLLLGALLQWNDPSLKLDQEMFGI